MVLLFFCTSGYAENIDPDNDGSQYAYGENVGWLNAEPQGDAGPGVEVSDSELTGYMWAENIGWINLSPVNYGGVFNDGSGNLSGYAWGENVGWINFNPQVAGDSTHHGVTIDSDGNFDGWAWGENIGWISFRSTGAFPFKVKTSWKPFYDEEGPITSNVVANPNPLAVGMDLTLTATVDDSTTGNSNVASAEYKLDDGSWTPMAAEDDSFDSPTEDVSVTFTFPMDAGVYDLCVRGTDEYSNIGPEKCIFLVVYDPDGGFVSGGGWIWSQAGAYAGAPQLEGKAMFGFVSKYKKGADTPTGHTEFQFKVADLNFSSTWYHWMVVAGAKAQYKGTGTINGEGEYKFMLTAIDADINESDSFDIDRFRIKIWEEIDDTEYVVYDNALGDDSDEATTEISGGSIVIHKSEK